MQNCSQCSNKKFDTIVKNGKEHDLCLACIDILSAIEDRESQKRIATIKLLQKSMDSISEEMELIGGVPNGTLPRSTRATQNVQNYQFSNSNFGSFNSGTINNSAVNGNLLMKQQNPELENLLNNLKTTITASTEKQEGSRKKTLDAACSLAEEAKKPDNARSLRKIKEMVSHLVAASEGLSQIEKIIIITHKILALL